MKKTIILLISVLISSLAYSQSIENGKSIFQDNCAICHKIGTGKMIGPDLAGVAERREKDWIFNFINNSGEMIASGDETAKALFEEFNNIAMPPNDFSTDELEDLLAYITETGNEAVVAANIEPAVETAETDSRTLEVTMAPPTWFLITASIIGVIIVLLLVVIYKLYRLSLRFQKTS